MAQYELTFLLNEESEVKAVKELLESFKGKILKEDNWGKKSLSYPIKKHTAATFYHWVLNMDSKDVLEFRKKLNYNEKLMRYLLLISEEVMINTDKKKTDKHGSV